jgi:hypothetical protein
MPATVAAVQLAGRFIPDLIERVKKDIADE